MARLVILGGAPVSLWTQARSIIELGIDDFWAVAAVALEIRPEIIAQGSALLRASCVEGATVLAEDLLHSLPKVCCVMGDMLLHMLQVNYFPKNVMDDLATDHFLLGPSVAFAHNATMKLKKNIAANKSQVLPAKCQDIHRHMAQARFAEDGLSQMSITIKQLPDSFLEAKENAQSILNQLTEMWNDATATLLSSVSIPLQSLATQVEGCRAKLAINEKVAEIVEAKAQGDWAGALLKLARGWETKSLLSALAEYDDNAALASLGIAAYSATTDLAEMFKTDDAMSDIFAAIARARSTIAVCSLLQAMYKNVRLTTLVPTSSKKRCRRSLAVARSPCTSECVRRPAACSGKHGRRVFPPTRRAPAGRRQAVPACGVACISLYSRGSPPPGRKRKRSFLVGGAHGFAGTCRGARRSFVGLQMLWPVRQVPSSVPWAFAPGRRCRTEAVRAPGSGPRAACSGGAGVAARALHVVRRGGQRGHRAQGHIECRMFPESVALSVGAIPPGAVRCERGGQ